MTLTGTDVIIGYMNNNTYIRKSTVSCLYDIDLGYGQIFGIDLCTLELLSKDIENELLQIKWKDKVI